MIPESDKIWWYRPEVCIDDEDPKAHEKLHTVITSLLRDQDRKQEFLLWGAMYAGGLPPTSNGTADPYMRNMPNRRRSSLSLPVSRNVVDAVVARLFSKSSPRVSVATVGGDYEKQDAAEKLELGIDGAMRKTKYYPKSVTKGLDGCVWGTGILRIRPNYDEEDVDVLRVMPWELIVDDAESVTNGNILWEGPRSTYLRYRIDKGVLAHRVKMGWYADGDESELAYKADMVMKLKPLNDIDAEFGFQHLANTVWIEEAWHKPSGRGANDGRYVVGIENCTLKDAKLDKYEQELSWYRWSNPLVGFYGQGIVEIGSGIQSEINKLVRQIQQGHHLITGHYLLERGAKIVLSHINNDLSSIIHYTGSPPQYMAPVIISPEVYQHLWALYSKYYELVGINQQAAQAQRPVGLDSGEAQRVYADQQTETLLDKGKRFEATVEEDGMLIACAAKRLAAKSVYEVHTQADDGFEAINWKELEEPNDFQMYVESTSALPGTLPGKLSTAQDMMQLGVFQPDDIVEMIGLPDLLQIEKRKLASRKLVEKKVGEMLRGMGGWEPEPFINLQEAATLATEMLLIAYRKDVEEANLSVVRDFIAKCNKMLKPPTPPIPPGMPPGAPSGLPPMPSPGGPLQPGAPMPPPGANGVMPT